MFTFNVYSNCFLITIFQDSKFYTGVEIFTWISIIMGRSVLQQVLDNKVQQEQVYNFTTVKTYLKPDSLYDPFWVKQTVEF